MTTEPYPLERLGTPLAGPTAISADLGRLWRLAWTLAVTDFKLRFFGSVLGYLWQLMRPLLLFGVLYAVFTEVVRIGGDVELYPVALLLGIVLYTFCADATSGAVSSMVDRESLLRKVAFPRLAVPLASVLQALFNLGLNLVAVAVFLVVAGGEVRPSWLELPALVAILALMLAGVGSGLAALYVQYRDVKPIWEVALQILFYASPVFYPIEVVLAHNADLARVMLFNPFAAVLQQARHAFVAASQPSAAAAMGGAEWLVVPAVIAIVLAALGLRGFIRRAPRIAEDL